MKAISRISDPLGASGAGQRSLFDKRISKVVQAPGFIRGINPKSKI